MGMIDTYYDMLDEELEGAKCYAEKYIEQKVMHNSNRSQLFWNMANEELKHASNIHQLLAEDMASMGELFALPDEVVSRWERKNRIFAENTAIVKTMLAT